MTFLCALESSAISRLDWPERVKKVKLNLQTNSVPNYEPLL